MTIEDLINYHFGVLERYNLDCALERIVEVDENITVKELLEIVKKPLTNN